MGATRGRQDPSVEGRLRREPQRFEFFQAVRLLEATYRTRARRDRRWKRGAVGGDEPPATEVVRFRAHPSLSFAPGQIADLEQPRPADIETEWSLPPLEMTVSFMGLTGPASALPTHYTTTLIGRLRARDYALQGFLDLFNHRSVSLFYRAWEKYRLGSGYEEAGQQDAAAHLATWCLYCLVGLGTERLRGRTAVPDEAFLFYGGVFSRRVAPASSLREMLAEYFDAPVDVQQFQGEWLHLNAADRTRLPSQAHPLGRYNQLGVDTVLGQQVWDVRGRFRVRVGPLSYARYRGFFPGAAALRELGELTRAAVGAELAFDVQPVLRAEEIPPCVLDSSTNDPPRLGVNVWLRTGIGEQDFDGVSFEPGPSRGAQ